MSWQVDLRTQASDAGLASAVIAALEDLLARDSALLIDDANERSATHRLAMYLEQHLPSEWNVDCEYNRDGSLPKRLRSELDAKEGTDGSRVFPDIIVHKRRTKDNLLVVEVKKTTSKESDQKDLDKLAAYRKDLDYRHALFIRLHAGTSSVGVDRVIWVPARA